MEKQLMWRWSHNSRTWNMRYHNNFSLCSKLSNTFIRVKYFKWYKSHISFVETGFVYWEDLKNNYIYYTHHKNTIMDMKYPYHSCVEGKDGNLHLGRLNKWHNQKNCTDWQQHDVEWLTSLAAHGTYNQPTLQRKEISTSISEENYGNTFWAKLKMVWIQE